MPIVKKVRKLGGRPSFGPARRESSLLRPQFVDQAAPCSLGCPNHTDVRQLLTALALGEARGLTRDQAAEEAFYGLAERNPLPACSGCVCPHHCEDDCNRGPHDEPLCVHQVERAVGEYALERGWPLRPLCDARRAERLAVVGAGPAGLSAAYQLARRGYTVTVLDDGEEAGGELWAAVREGLLPAGVLRGEVARIAAMGVVFARRTKATTPEGFARAVATRSADARGKFVPASVAAGIHFGRIAAERVDADLRGQAWAPPQLPPSVPKDRVRLDHYAHAVRPQAEGRGLTIDEAIAEARRCLACGGCLQCDNCWKYCPDQAVLKPIDRGQPYRFRLEFCQGCSKCAEECPTGYIEMR